MKPSVDAKAFEAFEFCEVIPLVPWIRGGRVSAGRGV